MSDAEQLDLFSEHNPKRRQPASDRVDYESAFLRELIEDAREASGISKAEIARAMGREPAALRRLLTTPNFNPELRTLLALADAVGMRVQLVRKRGRPKRSAG